MKYIDTIEEYYKDSEYIVERRTRLTRKTGNEVGKLLGKSERAGKEIFKTINQNVETLEQLIDEFNKKHESAKIKKSPLEVKIDKAKLDLKYLISLTKLKKAGFIADVIVSNIINYKILIRPIKNARIIALAYRYYLAIIRHALQSSLIQIELSSDLFFTQINANLVGRRKQMKDMIDNITERTKQIVVDSFESGKFIDEKTGQVKALKNIVSPKQLKEITQLIKASNTVNRDLGQYDRTMGYNQNVFQDFGRTLESQLKGNQDKELQSLAEKFSNIANSTTGFAKDDQASAREHVSNYAAAVKMSVEARAMEICEQINLNMFEIIKMFSLRNIDGFSEYFEEENSVDKLEKEYEDKLKAMENKYQDEIANVIRKYTADIRESTSLSEEDQKEALKKWKEKGIDTLCTEEEFNNIVKPNKKTAKDILEENGFTEGQINKILIENRTVNDYGKVTYKDLRYYLSGLEPEMTEKYKFKDDDDKDDDDLLCWMYKRNIDYLNIMGKNSSSEETKRREQNKHRK